MRRVGPSSRSVANETAPSVSQDATATGSLSIVEEWSASVLRCRPGSGLLRLGLDDLLANVRAVLVGRGLFGRGCRRGLIFRRPKERRGLRWHGAGARERKHPAHRRIGSRRLRQRRHRHGDQGGSDQSNTHVRNLWRQMQLRVCLTADVDGRHYGHRIRRMSAQGSGPRARPSDRPPAQPMQSVLLHVAEQRCPDRSRRREGRRTQAPAVAEVGRE